MISGVPTIVDPTNLLLRGRAVEARWPHKPEVMGSNPIPATNYFMIQKSEFVREFSSLLIKMSKPKNKILDRLIKSKALKKFALNNPDIVEKLNSKRSVPIERVRFLASDIYNLITDKR